MRPDREEIFSFKNERLENLAALARENMKIILSALICLAVIAGAVSYLGHSRREREITASVLMERGKTHLREGNPGKAREYLETVASEHPSTRAAQEAPLYLARTHIAGDDHEKALVFLREYLKDTPDGNFAPQAYMDAGFAAESLERYEEAARYYSSVHEKFPGHYLAPQSMLDAARCFRQLGELASSREFYRRLLEAYPWSASAEVASSNLESLPGKPAGDSPRRPEAEPVLP